jgi:hypothetical protein
MPTIRDHRKPGWLWADRNVIKRDGQYLGAHTIAVYVALCSFAGENQTAWPSHATIAEVAGISTRQVIRCIKKLVETGWILSEQRLAEEGDKDSNIYTLLSDPKGGSDRESVRVVTGSQYGTDRESHEVEPLNESQLKKKRVAASQPTTALSEGMKYCLQQFSRKRFSTKGQRETLSALEQEVGTVTFKRAVDWRANLGGLDANAVVTCARKMAAQERRDKLVARRTKAVTQQFQKRTAPRIRTFWDDILDTLRSRVPKDAFDDMFGGTTAQQTKEGIIIYAKSERHREWIDNRLRRIVEEAVHETQPGVAIVIKTKG